MSTRHLRRGLQISKGNDFFVDKKLNGLLLPVVHVTVRFITVHSWNTERSVNGLSSLKEKDEGGRGAKVQGYKRERESPTSSELKADALLLLIGLLRRLPVATVIIHHGPALVHQLLLKDTHTHTQNVQLHNGE